MTTPITCDRGPDGWTITLDRPKYGNALSAALDHASKQARSLADQRNP
jgi:hypothetical protein